MGIGAYTMAILVVKEDLNMWVAACCGVALAMFAGVLLGLPTLRLRADYFAITTIAFSEILRYIATNEDRLTGGSQGTINLAGIGRTAQYDGEWQSFLSPDDCAPLLTFFAWMIVILGGLGRAWTVPVGAIVFGVIFAGTRFFDFPPFSLLDSTERAYVRLIVIGVVIIGLMLFRPQGIFGNRKEMVLE